ncbi:glycoside hydrolase family 30 beta sandwich domain-containing protein [Gillisia limnaea]|uniref:glycoside hydrolase family 30 beta sandwich domain-containing protein n=1 Tax=Gillisia limnaea TaxID=195907 RepID=UPI00031FD262|nr:glycoside hydrolase family 30 beta sandwich domain-containing protein [Gillisia limnaea]
MRIASNTPVNLPNVAFRTSDAKTAVIIQDKAEMERLVNVKSGEIQTFFNLPAGAVGTLIL